MNCVEVSRIWNGRSEKGGTNCFDPRTGVLLLVRGGNRPLSFPRQYSNYEPWAGKEFPRLIRDFEGAKLFLQASVLSLSPYHPKDLRWLQPPAGAKVGPVCDGTAIPPKAIKAPEPAYPAGSYRNGTVVVYIYINKKGQVIWEEVVQSLAPRFDVSTFQTVWGWQFAPATCGGIPVNVGVTVEVNFRH